MSALARARSVGTAVFDEAREKHVAFLAGGLAYYAFVSVLPLLYLAVLAVSLANRPALTEQLYAAVRVVAPSAERLIQTSIRNARAVSGVSLVSGLALLWSGSKLFRGFETAFSEIYETDLVRDWGRVRRGLYNVGTSLLVLVVVAVGLAVVGGARLALAWLLPPALVDVLAPVVLFGGLLAVLFPVYYLFPDADVSVRGVLPGVAVAAVGWTALQLLFGLYLDVAGGNGGAGDYSTVLGVVLVFLAWLYAGSIVFLVGAVVNAVVEGYAGPAAGEERTLGGAAAASYLDALGESLADGPLVDGEERTVEIDERFGGADKELVVRWVEGRDDDDDGGG